MNFKWIVKHTLILQLLCCAHLALGVDLGGEKGNGGNEQALEFKFLAYNIYSTLIHYPDHLLNPEQLARFYKAIGTVRVEFTYDDLFIDGDPKDAVNFPKHQVIWVNAKRWGKISNPATKRQLVFHELLMVAAIADANYQISSQIYRALGEPSYQVFITLMRTKLDLNLLLLALLNNSKNHTYECFLLGGLETKIMLGRNEYERIADAVAMDLILPVDQRRVYLALLPLRLDAYCSFSKPPNIDLFKTLKQRQDILQEALWGLMQAYPIPEL